MTSVTITLPDGSAVLCPQGRPCATSRRRSRRVWRRRRWRGRRRPSRRSHVPARARRRRPHRDAREPRGAGACTVTARRTCSRPRSRTSFPASQCGIGPATDEGFFYDFVVQRPFVPEDLDAIEKKMRELAQQDLPYERQMWPREEAKQFFGGRGEPLKVQLIDEKTEGQSEVSCYTIKDRDTFVDFCIGPHVPVHRQAQGVQAAQHLERLLEGRRAQPADAARLRHGVPLRQGAAGVPARASRKPRSATTARSAASRSCSCSTRGRRAPRSGWRRARCCTTRSPTTCAACSFRPATSR